MQHPSFTLANCSVPGKQTEPAALEVLSCVRSSSSKIAVLQGDRTRDQAVADSSRIQQLQPHTAQVLAPMNTCWFSSASLGNTSCRDQLGL